MSHFEWIDLPNPGTVGRSFEWLGQEEVELPPEVVPGSTPRFSRTAVPPAGVSPGMLFRVPGDPRWHYFVKEGDTLGLQGGIADRGVGTASRWPEIVAANKHRPKSTAEDCRLNPGRCPAGNFRDLFPNEVIAWPENWPVNRIQSVDLFGSGDGKGGFSAAGMSGGTIALAVAVLAALGLAVANWGKA